MSNIQDPMKMQMRVIADLQDKLKRAEKRIAELELTNKTLAEGKPAFRPRKHIKVVYRKDGQQKTNWGDIVDVVRKSEHLTCREIVNITGFERCAVYAAARRLGIKLKSPFEGRPKTR